jgi:hypothetical protein
VTVHSGRGWRLAPSLVAMEHEANRIAPRRSQRSDGSIGDQSHRNRTSDHNPSSGYVHALDLTHDPLGGFDAHARVRTLVTRRDPRVKYIISNRRIYGPGSKFGWGGGPYSGDNPHTMHAHVSVQPTQTGRHDTSPWFKASVTIATPPINWTAVRRWEAGLILPDLQALPYLHPKVGAPEAPFVKVLQRTLNLLRSAGLNVDGIYGHTTTLHVIAWQEDCRKFGLQMPDKQGDFGAYTKLYAATAVRDIRDGR